VGDRKLKSANTAHNAGNKWTHSEKKGNSRAAKYSVTRSEGKGIGEGEKENSKKNRRGGPGEVPDSGREFLGQ